MVNPRRFLLSAVALMLMFYAFYYYPHAQDGLVGRTLQLYLTVHARVVAVALGALGEQVSVHKTVITGRFTLQIVKSCSSLDAQALYIASVLAFPARAGVKLLGLSLGVLGLTLLNMTRIVILYFVGVDAPSQFETVHEELMPLTLVACACGGFFLWARWAGRRAG